mgnify:CR=1 FL=1
MDIILPIVMLGITGLILGGIFAYASKVFEVIIIDVRSPNLIAHLPAEKKKKSHVH